MSRQLIDTATRLLSSVSGLIEKGKYKKALENAEKGKKLAEKLKEPDLIHWAMLSRAEVLEDSGRLEEALEAYEGALDYSLELFLKKAEDVRYQGIMYNSIGRIGKILEELDSFPQVRQTCTRAVTNFEKSLAAYEGVLAKDPENYYYLSNYLKTMQNIEACYSLAEDFEKQAPIVENIVQTYGKVFEFETDEPEHFIRLDSMVRQFGEACLDNGRFEEAERVYGQVLNIYEGVLEKEPENEFVHHFLIPTYDYLGGLYSEMGELDRAEETYLKALEIIEVQIRKEPEELTHFLNRGKIYRDIGINFSETGEQEKAGLYYEKATRSFEEMLGKYPEDLEYQYELTRIFRELAEFFRDLSRVENAKTCYLHEIEIYESLLETEPEDIDNVLSIAESYDQIAELYDEADDLESSKEYYIKEMEVYQKLLSENPEETEYERYMVETLNSLGDLHLDTENQTARQYYEKALEISEKDFEENPEDLLTRRNLIQSLKNLSYLYKSLKQYETAIPFQQRVVELELELGTLKETPGDWMHARNIGSALSELGHLFEKTGNPERAEELHSKAIETFSAIILDPQEKPEAKTPLLFEIRMRAFVYLRSRKYASAKPYLKFLRKYYEDACKKDPDDPDNLTNLFGVLYPIGLAHYETENFEEALASFNAAHAVQESLIKITPENHDSQLRSVNLQIGFGMVHSALNEYEKSEQFFKEALSMNEKFLEEEPEFCLHLETRALALKE